MPTPWARPQQTGAHPTPLFGKQPFSQGENGSRLLDALGYRRAAPQNRAQDYSLYPI